MRISHCKIKKIRLAYKRNLYRQTDVKPDVSLLKILHHSIRRIQPESAATGKYNSMNHLCSGKWIEKF